MKYHFKIKPIFSNLSRVQKPSKTFGHNENLILARLGSSYIKEQIQK